MEQYLRINDGGRASCGYRSHARGDCVCRAVAIATGESYKTIYRELNKFLAPYKPTKYAKRGYSSSNGVTQELTLAYMASKGWGWVTCRVPLLPEHLPNGTIICQMHGHVVAVKDGVRYDTHDCNKRGIRIINGYWRKK